MVIVSVIVSVYNNESTINRMLDSIAKQSLKEWELVITDDKSTDKTYNLIRKWSNGRDNVTIVKNDKNIGLAESLNKCIDICGGKYIARIDGDDEMILDRLEKQVLFLEENPEIGVLGGGALIYDLKTGDCKTRTKPELDCKIREIAVYENPIIHGTVMVRAPLLIKHKYNALLRKRQDYELWSRMLLETKFHNLGDILLKKYHVYEKPCSVAAWSLLVRVIVAVRFRSIYALSRAVLIFWKEIFRETIAGGFSYWKVGRK